MLEERYYIDRNECEKTNLIQNGYFYILEYDAYTQTAKKKGFDGLPLIYCIGPDEMSINAFWGINLHYFDKSVQLYILNQMQKQYHIFLEDVRVLLDGKQLNAIYSNMGIGLRCYNRKNVMDSFRIKMPYVPKYLGLEGKFRIMDSNDAKSKFDLAPGNKGF
jgi:hypothetical protein